MAYGLWHETNGHIKARKGFAPITCYTPLAIRSSPSAFQFPSDRVISQWQKGYSAAHNLCVVLGLDMISTTRI
jgi:hypothetical protein